MSSLRIGSDLDMSYHVDDYTDPWRTPEVILLLHGNAESSAAWYAWVPHLARELRVVRPDMRGFGASTVMPIDYHWSMDRIIDDFMELMRELRIDRFHLVGAKIGGHIARSFAIRHPDRVSTLTLVGTPTPHLDHMTSRVAELIGEFREKGVESWARRTMKDRLGTAFPDAGFEWWAKLMGASAPSTQISFFSSFGSSEDEQDLSRIKCPTLVITSDGSSFRALDKTRAWQEKIPHSSLVVLSGDASHVAATDADRCARETLAFIKRAHAN